VDVRFRCRRTVEMEDTKKSETQQQPHSVAVSSSNLGPMIETVVNNKKAETQQQTQKEDKKKKDKKKKKGEPDEETLKRETLSLDEFNELYNIDFDLNPKNFSISMQCETSSEPEFIVDLIVKIKFNTITYWKEIKYEKDPESSRALILEQDKKRDKKCTYRRSSIRQDSNATLGLERNEGGADAENLFRSLSLAFDKEGDITKEKSFAGDTTYEEFSRSHLLPIPTIRVINDSAPDPIPDTFHLRKLPIKKTEKDRLDVLMRKATGGNGTNSWFCLKMVQYEAVQLYHNFRIPFDGYTKAIKRFPLDTHPVNFGIIFTPVFTYCTEKRDHYELKVGDNKAKKLKLKGYYYPKVKTLKHFPLHSYVFVDERILDLDTIPESLRINQCDYGIRNSGAYSNRKVALMISFSLYRLITAPFINLFLPIYTIAILIPFSLFFRTLDTDRHEVAVDFDLIATYLSTLLLTLVAHRQVISSSQLAAIAFTTCDRDFLLCLLMIVVQMIFHVVISNIGKENLDEIYTDIFYIEEALILFVYVLPRSFILLSSSERNMRTKPLPVSEYMEFRLDTEVFGLRTKRVQQKTFFSTNIKLIAGYGLQQAKKAGIVATPIDDLLRIRLYDDEKARETLMEINMNPFFEEEYTEKLTEGADGIKIVYSHTKDKTLLLEVQILFIKKEDRMMNSFDEEAKLRRYRKSKMEKLSEYSAELVCLTKGQARWLYCLSCFIEVYSMFAGRGVPRGLYAWNQRFNDSSFYGVLSRLLHSWRLILEEWSPCAISRRMRENWTRIQEDGKLLDVVLFLLDSRAEHERTCSRTREKINKFFPEDDSK